MLSIQTLEMIAPGLFRRNRPALAGVLLLCAVVGWPSSRAQDLGWPQFRGPDGRGISKTANPPVVFNQTTNLAWKMTIPRGVSSPIVVEDKVFITGLGEGNELQTLCLNRYSGKILWQRSIKVEKLEPSHSLSSPASATPVSDGKRVYVYFGSLGLIAYALDGSEIWTKQLPQPVVEFGSSASPILADGKLIFLCDQDLGSYLLALDPSTGNELWRVKRDEFPRGFGSPFYWKEKGEIIAPGTLWLVAYSPASGQELWRVHCQARVVCTTPAAEGDLLFAASWTTGGDATSRLTMPSFKEFTAEHDTNRDGLITKKEMPAGPLLERYAQIDFDKNQSVTEEEWTRMAAIFARVENSCVAIRRQGAQGVPTIEWKITKGLPYVPSPLAYERRLWLVKNGGIVSCLDAVSGKAFFMEERLGAQGDYHASPVAAAGRVYFVSQQGVITVVRSSDQLEILARNDLQDSVLATPALAENRILIRGAKTLYCFGLPEKL